jgi:hypothetical protein
MKKLFFLNTLMAAFLVLFGTKGYAFSITHLNNQVLKIALHAYNYAKKHNNIKSDLVTIVDFSLPSNQKRLWVIDADDKEVLYNTWVSHGAKSGGLYATKFSNKNGSHESSIGVYKTGGTYYGSRGFSLRLQGLDEGFNDHAMSRHVVVHGASYVSQDFVEKYGRVGRSWGCFALPENLNRKIIDNIKNGSILVAYYPDKDWLDESKYI